jgi:hypothetical protein
MHEDLVQANKMLMATHAETIEANKSNWQHGKITPSPALLPLQTIPPPTQLDQSMYPKVRFWTKQEWKDNKNNCKDSSDLGATSSSHMRGGTRAALGKNVWVHYVKHADGKMVSGGLATEIQDHARTIWQGLWS